MLSAPAEAVSCRPAAASSTACSPFAAPSWRSAVHAAAPSPPPPPTSAPAAVFAAGSRSATLPIAGSVALNRRVSLSFHGTCPTLLLSAASSHARLPKAHGADPTDSGHPCEKDGYPASNTAPRRRSAPCASPLPSATRAENVSCCISSPNRKHSVMRRRAARPPILQENGHP